jgi:DNA-directed RNA polymerase subunit omega
VSRLPTASNLPSFWIKCFENHRTGIFCYCAIVFIGYSYKLDFRKIMNAELCKRAMEKVGNPNVLVNLISRRVRQLNAGGGGLGRPLVDVPASMGLADIALTEIVEEKMGWEMPEEKAAVRPVAKKRKKH